MHCELMGEPEAATEAATHGVGDGGPEDLSALGSPSGIVPVNAIASIEPSIDEQRRAHSRVQDLVSGYVHFVWRSLRRLGVPEADCDDGCQRVWLVLAQKIDSVEAEKQRSYVFSVVVRVACEMRRETKRHEHAELDESELESKLSDAESIIEERRERQLLDELLSALSWEQRTVFVMFEIEGLSSPEIAATLGVSRGTVASRIRLAREAFQRRLLHHRARVCSARGRRRTGGIVTSLAPVVNRSMPWTEGNQSGLEQCLIRSALAETACETVRRRASECVREALALGSPSVGTSDSNFVEAPFAASNAAKGLPSGTERVIDLLGGESARASLWSRSIGLSWAALPVASGIAAAVITVVVTRAPVPFPEHAGPNPAASSHEGISALWRATSIGRSDEMSATLPTTTDGPRAVEQAPATSVSIPSVRPLARLSRARPKEPKGPAPSSLAAELSLVKAARSKLQQHRGADALRLLDEYHARFPNGKLAPEVDSLRRRAIESSATPD